MKDEPIIMITAPEITTIESEGSFVKKDIYNYENSHVIYKGHDLGSFEELLKQKDMIKNLNNKIEHLENDYYHALSLITGNEKLTKRKKKVLEEEYELYAAIRVTRLIEHLNRGE